ncbi:MAG: hypothetical protein Q9178_000207 [Gyalolechia marmorata]
MAGSELSSKRDVQIDCARRLRCPPGGKSTKVNGRCLCLPAKLVRDVSEWSSIDAEADLVLSFKRDVQIDCARRLRCPPGGKSTKVNGRCLCLPAKLVRDVPRSDSVEEAVPQTLGRNAEDNSEAAPVDCASIAKCRGNQRPVNIASDRCECVDNDKPDAAPMDCASIAKCPGNQHPVNVASDRCKCVDNDKPDTGILDCSAITKCRPGQHPVFINNAGRCECIPDGTQLDCPSIAKCSKGAHPINHNGNCVCVSWFPNQLEERDFSSADASL